MNALRGILQKAYSLVGVLSIGLSVLFGVLAMILTLISRNFLIQVLKTVASPILAYLLGENESSEKIAYLIMLINFSPLIMSLMMLLGSVIVSIIVTLPDLFSAYCLSKNSDWLPIVMGVSIVKNIALFPLGTILSVLSIVYLIGYFLGNTTRKT